MAVAPEGIHDRREGGLGLDGPGRAHCCALWDCCGRPPKERDNSDKVEAQGGRVAVSEGGRTLEYFTYGSRRPDAAVLVQIGGAMGTGKLFTRGQIPDKCEELNIRGISITVPGHAFSTANVGWKISEFPRDVEAVLEAEGVDGDFMVEGTSYGSAHAMAIAHHFGDRIRALHLHVPYLPRSVAEEVTPGHFASTMPGVGNAESLQRCSACYVFCCISCLCCCIRCKSSTYDDEYPEGGRFVMEDLKRISSNGVYGVPFNLTEEHVLEWGFDPREITLRGPARVLVSFAEDDDESPPGTRRLSLRLFQRDRKQSEGRRETQLVSGQILPRGAD
jgi:pimeloyl-ACP methyl ester carboxylesterase